MGITIIMNKRIVYYMIGIVILTNIMLVTLVTVSYSQNPDSSFTYPTCMVVSRLDGCEGYCKVLKIHNGCSYNVKVKITKRSRRFNICPDLTESILSGQTKEYESSSCYFSSVRIIE